MVNRYEALILTVPEITQDETAAIESSIAKIINDGKGSIISYERWGKYKLAYPIQKNDYGVYFLVRFELPNVDVLADIRATLMVRYNEVVMRHMIAALDAKQPLTYQRPRSLEEAPTGRDAMFRDRADQESKGLDDMSQDMQGVEE